jgi:hypothetical protein
MQEVVDLGVPQDVHEVDLHDLVQHVVSQVPSGASVLARSRLARRPTLLKLGSPTSPRMEMEVRPGKAVHLKGRQVFEHSMEMPSISREDVTGLDQLPSPT